MLRTSRTMSTYTLPFGPNTGSTHFRSRSSRSPCAHTSDPLLHPPIPPQCPFNQSPCGVVLRGLIKREEEPVTIGEVLHRLAVHRLERAHVPQDTLNALQCVDGLPVRDGSGGRSKASYIA
jgi:hypothetical protein